MIIGRFNIVNNDWVRFSRQESIRLSSAARVNVIRWSANNRVSLMQSLVANCTQRAYFSCLLRLQIIYASNRYSYANCFFSFLNRDGRD